MSYRIKIDPKSRRSAKFIALLQRKIQTALVESGMTQQQVAEVLGVDRSVVNRRLKGKANLTARSIAEFAYAFDKDVTINFVDRHVSSGSNGSIEIHTAYPEVSQLPPGAEGSINVQAGVSVEQVAS